VPVPLAPKALDLLLLLVTRPAAMVTKDEIMQTLWPDVAVTDNALTQVVSDLRQALADDPMSPRYIQTVPRRGYRFIAAVDTVESRQAVGHTADRGPDRPSGAPAGSPTPPIARAGVRETSSLDAYRSFTEGRLKLERMDPAQVPSAIRDFEKAIALDPLYAPPYVGLAHARFWLFEASRARNRPDASQLTAAIADAHHAIDLDPDLSEAHAALALMLTAAWRTREAVVAGRRSVALDPGNWRNYCRLAVAAWGQERLAAFEQVLALYPEFAYAFYGMAMVHIARHDLDAAAGLLGRGIPFQDRLAGGAERFPAKGLHWLLGLIQLARGDTATARREFERELASGGSELYAAEFAMNACDGLGFALLRDGDADGAVAMFNRALEACPDHARSLLGLADAHARTRRATDREIAIDRAEEAIHVLGASGRAAEAAVATAFRHVVCHRPADAIDVLNQLLIAAPPGFAGWSIPVEPFFSELVATPAFSPVLRRLAERAS
jgi:DNA-binding winged helix-turn-helix (wHTH) protein/Flp pilus assembly protein TadD